MEPRILACSVLATLLALSLGTPGAARLYRYRLRRFAGQEGDDSWAVRTLSQRPRPVYHGVADADIDAAAEESVRQVEAQAPQRSTPGPRYLPTPAARRKDAAKSTPGPKYLPTTASTDADDVTKVTRQETTWFTVTSSHVRSSTPRSDVSSTKAAATATTQEISNDVRSKPSHRRGRVRYRSSVPESFTRSASAPRASRRRTTHATTASSVDVQTAAPKRVTDSAAPATTSKPHSSKTSAVTAVPQNASANAHKSPAGTGTSAKKSKQDSAVRNVGTLETQKIPASFWKSLREELLNTAAEDGPETKKGVRETKDSSSTESAATGGKEVKAKASAEAGGSPTKSCGQEKGNHTAAASRRKANETAKAPAAPHAAAAKATSHATSKSPAATTARPSQSTASRQAPSKGATTPSSGGTTPISRETSTAKPEKKQQGSGSRTEPPKQEATTQKAEPVTAAKRSSEATTAAAGGHHKVAPAAS